VSLSIPDVFKQLRTTFNFDLVGVFRDWLIGEGEPRAEQLRRLDAAIGKLWRAEDVFDAPANVRDFVNEFGAIFWQEITTFENVKVEILARLTAFEETTGVSPLSNVAVEGSRDGRAVGTGRAAGFVASTAEAAETCPNCNGTGERDHMTCRTCGGCGAVYVNDPLGRESPIAALARPECPFCRVHFRGTGRLGTAVACQACNRPLVGSSSHHGHRDELSEADSLTMLNEYRVGARHTAGSGSGVLTRWQSGATVPPAPDGFEWLFVFIDCQEPHFVGWPFSEGEAEEQRAGRGVWAGFHRTVYRRDAEGRVREPVFRF